MVATELTMRIDEIERVDEILPAIAAVGGAALRTIAGQAVKNVAKTVGAKVGAAAAGVGRTAANVGKQVGRRIGAGRNPVQDRGTGSAFSGNPPKKSLGSIGSMPGAKTSPSKGADNNRSPSPTADMTPGTTGTIGTQSAADMRNSASNGIDTGSTYSTGTPNMQDTQSNIVEPDELKTGDKLTVKVEPGSKNLKLVYPDENTEAEVPRELLRLQQLAGMQQ